MVLLSDVIVVGWKLDFDDSCTKLLIGALFKERLACGTGMYSCGHVLHDV
jgi:hypothetical protein